MRDSQAARWFIKIDYSSIQTEYEKHVEEEGDGFMVSTFDTAREALSSLPRPRFKFMKMPDIVRTYRVVNLTESALLDANDYFKTALGVREADGSYGFWFHAIDKMAYDPSVTFFLDSYKGGALKVVQPICAGPGCSNGTTKTCSGCNIVQYCDVSCQRAHWKEHKKSCRGHGIH